MGSNYESWTLKQLQTELKLRKIKSSGKKKVLIERLHALDVMKISGREQDMEVEYHMTLPDASTYIDVHCGTSLPNLPMARIYDYLKNQEKNLDEKIRSLYDERYIRFVRVSRNNNSGFLHITGSVWAEMRKSVAYKVDFTLDENQVIQEAQCECAAGQGPSAHCKHVACILYGVYRFTVDGDILTEKTCTQRLQTFHHCKPYKGSPMKACDIQDIRKQKLEYDPRPENCRNQRGYPDMVRNKIINFQGEGKMPALQMYQPANPYAVNAMHDYIMSSEEAFLKREKLTAITPEEAGELEFKTRGQAKNKLWMEERSKRITSSNFGSIVKATARRDMVLLTNQIVSPKPFYSRATNYGKAYESVAVEHFEQLHGQTQECGLFVDKTYPWLAASPDRVLDFDTVVEIKCPFTAKDKPINHITVPYLRNDVDGLSLDKNHNYFYQVQGQLMCADRRMCFFCVFTLKDFKVIKIVKDEQFIKEMVAKLKAFHENHFHPALMQKHVYRCYNKYFAC